MAETILEEPQVNTNNVSQDTAERLKNLRTQTKSPGTNNASTFTPPNGGDKKETGSGAGRPRENIDWNSNDDFARNLDDNDDEDLDGLENENRNLANDKPKIKFNHASKKASARIYTRSFDTAQTLGFTLALNKKFKKKFSDDEQKIITVSEGIEDNDRTKIVDPKKRQVLSKFDELMQRHVEKLTAVPMTSDEKEDMQQMLMDYQDYTQELLNPAWGIGLSAFNVLFSRTVDLLVD